MKKSVTTDLCKIGNYVITESCNFSEQSWYLVNSGAEEVLVVGQRLDDVEPARASVVAFQDLEQPKDISSFVVNMALSDGRGRHRSPQISLERCD